MKISRKKINRRKLYSIFTIVKFGFSLILMIVAAICVQTPAFILAGTIELGLVFIISHTLVSLDLVFGNVINGILQLIFNLQFMVLFFGRSFVTTVMIENLVSVEDLAGNFLIYGIGIFFLLAFSFIPMTALFQISKPGGLAATIAGFVLLGGLEAGSILLYAGAHAPFVSGIEVAQQMAEYASMNQALGVTNTSSIAVEEKELDQECIFYKPHIDDFIAKPETLPEQPNVILIFTEGLSQSVLDDEREIMPNMSRFQTETITFDHYYNHTFATYRGLSGQLYSGYQLNNEDVNNLISMQDVFIENGYHTTMINVEPYNEEFTDYLNNFGFDEVVTVFGEMNGPADTINDQEAYDLLFDVMENKPLDQPFFICMYTFGTHASFDSYGEVYGDGSDGILNKFYNADCGFGNFLEVFQNSRFAENTMIVLTTDHGSYVDNEYAASFSENERNHNMIDEIPLMIYYNGVEPAVYDVNGRNSLCMVPTVMDLLDLDHENMFLGSSLFSDSPAHRFETITAIGLDLSSTEDGVLQNVPAEETEELEEELMLYFQEKLK